MYLEYINPDIIDGDFYAIEEEEEEDIVGSEKAAKENLGDSGKQQIKNENMSKTDFFSFANKILPNELDGSPSKLQSVIDALNLLQAHCENHKNNAVAYVKTRLTIKARDLITENDTLEIIINILKTGIKTENSHMVTAKILSLKQRERDPSKYAMDIRALAKSLKRTYINEGVPIAVAELYATNTTVKALKTNANSKKVKIILEAGTFNTCDEAITKYICVSADTSDTNTVFYAKNVYQQRRSGNSNRYHRRHQSRGRGNCVNNYQ